MDLFWPMFFFMAFVVIIMIFTTISEVINKLGNIAKWLGLGAIAGNVINNKINSDTAIKQGRTWRKSRKHCNNGFLDDFEEFVSPSYESDEEHDLSDEESFREYQEFKSGKQHKKVSSDEATYLLFFTLIFFQMFLDDVESRF